MAYCKKQTIILEKSIGQKNNLEKFSDEEFQAAWILANLNNKVDHQKGVQTKLTIRIKYVRSGLFCQNCSPNC
jgi:hypothetical protein